MASEPPKKPNPITHYGAMAMAILCPIALILPSRGGAAKSTFQNAVLGGGSFWGFNRLAEDFTGKSITARSGERWGAMLGISSPSPSSPPSSTAVAADTTTKTGGIENGEGGEGEGGGATAAATAGFLMNLPTDRAARNARLMEAERKRRAEAEGKEYRDKDRRNWLERFWMGGESEGWKEKRLEEERKALEEGGKGYGGLIVDQLKEVWEGKGKGKGKGVDDDGNQKGGEGKKD
ncbi:exocyst complex component SEC3 [Chaetomidium leptoderma]|uniref:Exocyst complex component SEC3 n=1 Tax=Chaetomidium leptoderma TaxID=669021 RepID=A0AAN7A110_9PEZI|nr:exocyst complex component SEC3 [Chaetomidium leptoderma]